MKREAMALKNCGRSLEDERERFLEQQKNNLHFDLRTSDVIASKCQDRIYAQHLYAALCNNEFIKNEVWSIIQDRRWSCSWRYAGGIVADIREEGDYMNWYCSGSIGSGLDHTQLEIDNMTENECIQYKESLAFVSESIVTDEIKKDLFNLGWIVVVH